MNVKSIAVAVLLACCIHYPATLSTPYRDAKAGEGKLSEPTNGSDPLATADQRIESLRKASVSLRVLDGKGNPISNASVKIEMVRHAFLFGCGISGINRYQGSDRDQYEKEFADLFNYATLPFFWALQEPRQGQADYGRNDSIATWCKSKGILIKGHPLVWHHQYPTWAPNDPQEVRVKLKEHVTGLVSKYKGTIDLWDLFNEASGATQFKNGVGNWVKADGVVPAIGEAIDWVRPANPRAMLVINEGRARNPATLQLFSDLEKANKGFDIVGLQAHMHRADWPLDKVWSLCESYAPLKKPVHFTEVTVISGEYGNNLPKPWKSTSDGEMRQADYVEKFYTLLFSHPDVEAITWWDLMDGGYQGAPGGLLHADLSPKPAYNRLRDLIKNKWWTTIEARTDATGSVTFRGFLGDYRATVTTPKGQRTESFTLRKGQNNWSLRG